MNWIVFHVASGHAFFTGVTLVVIAVLASTRRPSWTKRVSVLCFLIGGITIAISSTAIPYWYYGFAILATLIWVSSCSSRKRVHWPAYAAAGIWVGAALLELPYHFMPRLKPAPNRSIAVIGDSLTAGLGEVSTETWPKILAREHRISVQDISHVGETASSALKRAHSQTIDSPVILVEIGGNDLLGSTTAAKFAKDLDALLLHLASLDRQIVMFELPLPPFYHEYGRIQRELAAKYNVVLVPKRVLLSVIAGGDATLDSIHLTQEGHQAMAKRVWGIVGSGYVKN